MDADGIPVLIKGGRCAAVCRQCSAPNIERGLHALIMPFGDADSRDIWATGHKSYGHEVAKIEGWPDADEAWRATFGEVGR